MKFVGFLVASICLGCACEAIRRTTAQKLLAQSKIHAVLASSSASDDNEAASVQSAYTSFLYKLCNKFTTQVAQIVRALPLIGRLFKLRRVNIRKHIDKPSRSSDSMYRIQKVFNGALDIPSLTYICTCAGAEGVPAKSPTQLQGFCWQEHAHLGDRPDWGERNHLRGRKV
jgi:hypothetical protein